MPQLLGINVTGPAKPGATVLAVHPTLNLGDEALPVIAYIAGLHASSERRMGHAGTVNVFGAGAGQDKVEALRGAGVTIASSVATIGATMRKALT